jgi:hypothetical protein
MKKTTLLLTALFTAALLNAQTSYMLHGFDMVPQSSYSNPAYISDSNTVVGFPLLSSWSASVYSTGFSFNDLFDERAGSDSLYLDLGNVVGEPGGLNYLATSVDNDLIHLGFKVKNSYLSTGIRHRLLARGFYVNDLIELVWYGNTSAKNRHIDLSPATFHSDHFISYYLGLAFPVGNRVSIGARVNLNRGMSNISTVYNDTRLLTEENDATAYALHAETKFLVNTSGISGDSTDGRFNPFSYYYNYRNFGVSLDLGADIKITERISINFSFLDFGYINWKSGLKSFENKYDTIQFEGIYVDEEVNNNGIMSTYIDSLEAIAEVRELSEPYRSDLPARLIIGAEYYSLDRMDRISFLFSGRFMENYFEPSFSVSFDKTLAYYFAFKVAYTYHRFAPFNLGAGVVFNVGPLQLYFLSDNVLSVINYRNQKYVNFHCGINFVVGE